MDAIHQFIEATEHMAKTLRSLMILAHQPADADAEAISGMINDALARYELAKGQLGDSATSS